jgi:hypothetical protein
VERDGRTIAVRNGWFVACAIVIAVPLVGYPAVLLARGAVVFPTSAAACTPAPVADEKVDVVFGRFDSMQAALALRDRALGAGFQGTEAVTDRCGRTVVRLHGIESIDVGHEIQQEAATVDLHPSLELSR